MKAIVKSFLSRTTTIGFQLALQNLLMEWRSMRQHHFGIKRAKKYMQQKELRLHLGCGPHYKGEWINIDLRADSDITLDLREPLPFADGSCMEIYSEHFLEHLDYPEPALILLHECVRVLAPGGRFRVGVPDTEWPLFEYCGLRHSDYFRTAKRLWHPGSCETRMEHINYHFRQNGEHRFAYDFETLAKLLDKAGFVDITHSEFDPARDLKTNELGTLYVDARKPD